MLQMVNSSGFTARLLVVPDQQGREAALVVVKGAFSLRTAKRLDEHPHLVEGDIWTGEPNHSQLREASDMALEKSATDVLLCGSAYAPGGVAQATVMASLNVGPVRKNMHVCGTRTWKKSFFGEYPSAPAAFCVQALDWDMDDVAPPIIEDPQRPTGRRRAPRMGWGCGPLPPTWGPRRIHAGTYDALWRRHRAPFLPADFDSRFFQVAPIDQQVPGYLQGGESIELINCTPDGRRCCVVPTVKLYGRAFLGCVAHELPLHLDTLSIWPNGEQMELVWRGLLPLGRKILDLTRVQIDD